MCERSWVQSGVEGGAAGCRMHPKLGLECLLCKGMADVPLTRACAW
jgi:hypothetical protein